ncbi:hypothetical protein [Spirosoma sp. 209]|uniref:hypothetical protein n=1 Tax=Spirosoma sp. 209 TaxID=1955701 RepID=UPI00098D34E4|nr:hypothetical protein [Spirosoma sp. 209]
MMRKKLSKAEIKAWYLDEVLTFAIALVDEETPAHFELEEIEELERQRNDLVARLKVDYDKHHTAHEKLDARLTNARY